MTALTDKLGVNDYGMYFNNNIDYEKFKSNWDYDMQMMSRLPINWIRIGYGYWEANINPDGSFNFDRLDYAINSALANGFKVIIPFFATFDGYKTPPDYQTALQNFKKLVTETITHLRNKAVVFEAVDEAFSGNHFWMNQLISDDVINDIMNINFLINQLSVAFNSKAEFINGDFNGPGNPVYVANANKAIAKGMLTHGTHVSYHPYQKGNPELMLSLPSETEFLNTLKSTGLSVSVTEFGYGSPNNFNGSYSRQQQSDYTLRQIFLLDMLGVEHIVYFTMDNSDKTWSLQGNYYDTGVVKGEKPAFNLVGNQLQELLIEVYGYSFKNRIETTPDDFCLVYEKDDELDKLIYWTTSTSHTFNGLLMTSTPQIMELSEPIVANENNFNNIVLDRLDSSNIIKNYQINLNILKKSFSEIVSFLEMYGLKYHSEIFADLSQYDKLDRNFLFALQEEIKKIDRTINNYIETFDSTSWLRGGDYDDYQGYSLFDTGEFKCTLNRYWNKFETNTNVLLGTINTIQRR